MHFITGICLYRCLFFLYIHFVNLFPENLFVAVARDPVCKQVPIIPIYTDKIIQ